ncbi:MAG: hypothetical protein MUF18_08260 [Fimbriiglobus sp.]|jgi:hypothetical protein|nr:hypothetical protein [Fimbriiglobus sp.]
MNPDHLLILLCAAFFVFVYLTAEVLLLRLACRIARVNPRTVFRSVGLVLASLFVGALAEGMLGWGIERAYTLGGFPIWEAGLVGFFVGLPVHMVLIAFLHAKMMRVTFGEGMAVWFVDKAMKLAIGGVALGLFVVLLNLQRFAR